MQGNYMSIKNIQYFNYKVGNNVSFKSNTPSVFDKFKNSKIQQSPINQIKYQQNRIITSENPLPSLNQTVSNNLKNNVTKKIIAIGISAIAIGVGIFALVINSRKKKPPLDEGIKLLKNEYSKLVEKFPEDKSYYEKLALEIGLKPEEEYKLSSIVGKTQLTSLLNKYTSKDFQVGDNFEGLKNLTYRVNLHNHTQVSDGTLSIQDLLEQARKWADRIAEKVKDDKPPFTIAITDHDTLDAAQEAVHIIAKNPEKYKNLRVVLGSEFSISHVDPKDVTEPLNFELVGYSLNPFNKEMCNFLKSLRDSRIETSKKIIGEINSKVPNIDLNWDEAANFHPNLGKATSNGSIYILRQYAAFKYAAIEYSKFTGSRISVQELMGKYATDYLNKVDLREIAEGDVQTYFRKLKLPNGVTLPDFSINKDILKTFVDIKNDYVLNSQKLIDNKVIATPEQFFAMYKNSGDSGMFGLAHPGFLNTAMYSKDIDNFCTMHPENDRGHHLAWRLFNHLHETGKDLFKCSETNYQSYDKSADRKKWAEKMNGLAANFNLLKTGGIDCHKTSIFLKHEKLTEKQIYDFNLKEIVEIHNENHI